MRRLRRGDPCLPRRHEAGASHRGARNEGGTGWFGIDGEGGETGYELLEVTGEGDWRDYHTIRREVLWEARGRTRYNDRHPDEYLPANHPLLLKLHGRPIGTTRLDDFGNGAGAVRLVAIVADLQMQGHGRKLAELVENYARNLGMTRLFVNAAPKAVGYYEKLGWHRFTWDETGSWGIALGSTQMTKSL
jgi:N-acetylglutamate synthase-like GNAT family acetyltransferase